MNLPNKLTLLRMIMIVPFVVILLTGVCGDYSKLVALIIFALASLTDMLDGMIARKYNLITNFGKFMDPLADKVLVSAGFVCLVELGDLPAWVVIVILAREFMISGFRLVASDNGIVIAASWWGKLKTVSHMTLVILLLLDLPSLTGNSAFALLNTVVMYIAVVLTIISLVDYVWKNRQVISDR